MTTASFHKRFARFAIFVLALAASSGFAQTGPTVWVASSLERVGAGAAAGTGPVAQLSAAKGEYESFQIVVRAPAGGLSNGNVTVSDLAGPRPPSHALNGAGRGGHSERSADIGSRRDARNAGAYPAVMATASSTTTVNAKVGGSVGARP